MPRKSPVVSAAPSPLPSDLEQLIAAGEAESARRRAYADAVATFEAEQGTFNTAINDACSNNTGDLDSWFSLWSTAGKLIAHWNLTDTLLADDTPAARIANQLTAVATGGKSEALLSRLAAMFGLKGTPGANVRAAIRDLGAHLQREFNHRQERQLREMFGDIMVQRDAATPSVPGPSQGRPERRSPRRMTKEAANEAGKLLLSSKQMEFLAWSDRARAKAIGCHFKTWTKTELSKRLRERQARTTSRQPRAVGGTDSIAAMASTGGRDEVLKQLIAEQDDESEPSPLEADAPDQPRRVRCRKRV